MIDGLNTQLAEVSSALAKRIAKLERDNEILGSWVHTLHQHVYRL